MKVQCTLTEFLFYFFRKSEAAEITDFIILICIFGVSGVLVSTSGAQGLVLALCSAVTLDSKGPNLVLRME